MRDVRQSERFTQEVEAIFPPDASGAELPHGSTYKDFDLKIMVGLDWALSRKPELFPTVPGTSLQLVKTDDYPGFPALNIWFTVLDDMVVELLSIEVDEAAYLAGPVDD